MWNIVIVDNTGSKTFKYKKIGSGAYSLNDAIEEAIKITNLKNIISVTATII